MGHLVNSSSATRQQTSVTLHYPSFERRHYGKQEKTDFEHLPRLQGDAWLNQADEIFLNIFLKLTPGQAAKCQRACRRFHQVAGDHFLWETFYNRDFFALPAGIRTRSKSLYIHWFAPLPPLKAVRKIETLSSNIFGSISNFLRSTPSLRDRATHSSNPAD